jgi:hypothetical protein
MESQVCLDPFEAIFPELFDFIFQHFTNKDIQKLSKVSKDWNHFISTSQICLMKTPLKFAGEEKVPFEIMESKKRFNNLHVFLHGNERTQRELLKRLAPWLKHLEIEMCIPYYYTIKALQMPKLETAEICSYLEVPFVFENVTGLKKLKYKAFNFDQEVHNWIQKQSKLKEFKLELGNTKFFDYNFEVPKSVEKFECVLRLEERFYQHADTSHDFEYRVNMLNTVTDLELHECDAKQLEMVVNQMPKLKSFKCKSKMSNPSSAKFNLNFTITKLELFSFNHFLNNLLLSLVNVEVLNIGKSMTIAEYEFIFRNMMKLREFYCSFSRPRPVTYENMIQRYESMKKSEADINKNIKFINTSDDHITEYLSNSFTSFKNKLL